MNARIQPERSFAGATLVGPVRAVAGLEKSFSGPPLLRGLAFQIAPGQSTALIGANGSGKSTLLKCLVRLIEPTAGSIIMLDCDVCALGPRDLRAFRAQVGIVWQRHNLAPFSTVECHSRRAGPDGRTPDARTGISGGLRGERPKQSWRAERDAR